MADEGVKGVVVRDTGGNGPSRVGEDRGPSFQGSDIPDVPAEADVEELQCAEGRAELGCGCSKGTSCESGFCVATSGREDICTKTCVDDCPAGWECRQLELPGVDATFVCLEQGVHICRPCRAHADCQEGGLGKPEDRCVSYGEDVGSFCGLGCQVEQDCPDGYTCEIATDTETGEPTRQCVSKAGICACTERAIRSAASTDCAHGTCGGERRCTEDGLTVCTARDASLEECNGRDDDCDGETDELGAAGCADYYVDADGDRWGDDAQPSQCLCEPDLSKLLTATVAGDCRDDETTINPAALETCDDVDNDCDGNTDQDAGLLGLPCDGRDEDKCRNGTWSCRRDGLGVECINEDPEGLAEVCNGADDDCDGAIDEAFEDLGRACDGEDLDHCANGRWLCAADAAGVVCGTETVVDLAEICNGDDDDCDSATDEGFSGIGLPCDSDDSDQCRNGVAACSGDGGEVLCLNDLPGDIPEACNGVDDDCDGATDEDFNEVTELCNERDDDCDGATDEGYVGLGLACDSEDTDLCTNGVRTCSADGLEVLCLGDSPADIVEACNGIDDDCDGTTDEGFDAITELCNRQDDDCDGQTDEGFEGLDEPCDGEDADLCRNAIAICSEDGSALVCPEESPADIAELCNGFDDDCDGQVDEDYPTLGEECDGADEDKCMEGVWSCASNALFCGDLTSTNVETCNGTDDDCDGETDEGYDGLGEPCDTDDADQCQNGKWVCGLGGVGIVCSDETVTDIAEVCNGVDDDCDTLVDKGFAQQIGQPCDGADEDNCDDGQWECAEGGLRCSDDEASKVELCNGADDDCDFSVDEDFAHLGEVCDNPEDSDLCAHGEVGCSDDQLTTVCRGDIPGNIVELCNNADDDCDGEVDEDYPELGTACDGLDGDMCANGTWRCVGGSNPVSTYCFMDQPSNITEDCNGEDDDCDGDTDEDFRDLNMACDGADEDKCANGVFICDDFTNDVVCNETLAANQRERCSGEDDDCDGETDEDYDLGAVCDGPDDVVCKHGVLACDAGGTGTECIDDDPMTSREFLTNGGFEEGPTEEWILVNRSGSNGPFIRPASTTSFEAYAGDSMLVLGGQHAMDTRYRQILDLPDSTEELVLRMAYRVITDENNTLSFAYDALQAELLDTANQSLEQLLFVSNLDASEEWMVLEAPVASRLRGRQIQLEISGLTDQLHHDPDDPVQTEGITWFLVDEVSLLVKACDVE